MKSNYPLRENIFAFENIRERLLSSVHSIKFQLALFFYKNIFLFFYKCKKSYRNIKWEMCTEKISFVLGTKMFDTYDLIDVIVFLLMYVYY